MRTLRLHLSNEPLTEPLNPLQGRLRVAACLNALVNYPAVYSAAAARQSLQPFLAEVFGISKSYIARGGLAKLKPRKRADAVAHAREVSLARALKGGWSLEEFEAHEQRWPRLASGELAATAAWVHSLQPLGTVSLPRTIALALEQDELVDVLLPACEADDFPSFKDAVLEAVVESHLELPANADPEPLRLWEWAECWDDVAGLFVDLSQEMMLNTIVALDAEWSTQYFTGFEAQPTFLWVAPRAGASAVGATLGKQRNQVMRPIRRLLEFSYAAVERGYLDAWPDGPVGRKELASALELPESIVGGLFDGTRRLGLKEYESFWMTLCRQPRYQARRKGIMATPSVLARIALAWEATFVETGDSMRFKSALLLDEADYRGRWQSLRNYWATQFPREPSAPKATEKWPEWLTFQSVLPSPTGV